MSLFWGPSAFDEQVDKATSELIPHGTSDIALNLEICDQIRSKSVTPQAAMRSIKRRVDHKNPNVQLLALELADTCSKNGGDPFLAQCASREFLDDLVSIAKTSTVNRQVKEMIVRLIQSWARGWEGKPECGYVGEVYKSLKDYGFDFPPPSPIAKTASLYQTATAPTWTDSPVCMRCRTPFTFTERKHHCRNCGQTFCQACSSKTARLDHFGITQEVRVCDGCYSKLNKDKPKTKKEELDRKDSGRMGSRDWVKKERARADEELERAIALSLAEARSHGYVTGPAPARPPPPVQIASDPELENDPDLLAAIHASLAESQTAMASAPSPVPESYVQASYFPQPPPPLPSYDLSLPESTAIIDFAQAVESGAAPKSIDTLRERADSLRPRLAQSLDEVQRREQILTEMNSKLAEVVKLVDHHYNAQLERRVASPYRQPERYGATFYAPYATQPMSAPPPQQLPQVYSTQSAPLPNQQYAPQVPSAYNQLQQARQEYETRPAEQQYSYAPHSAQQVYSPPQQQSQPPYAAAQQPTAYAPEAHPQYAPPPPQPQQQQPTYQEPHRQDSNPPLSQPYMATQPSEPPATARYASPAPHQQPLSPVMQMSGGPSIPVTAQHHQPPTVVPAPLPATYNPPVSQQASPFAPVPLSRQSSYAPPTPSQPAYAPASHLQRATSLAGPHPSAHPAAHHVPAQSPAPHVRVEPPRQYTVPSFPVAPQNVMPNNFPVAPSELPTSYAAYAPVREEKEVALIEL